MEANQRRRRPVRGTAAVVVVLAMLLAAFSLWTVIPLSWIYIGSRLSATQFPSGGPYMVVFVGIVLSILFIAWLLGRLNALYARITGTHTLEPIRPTWMRSMRDTPMARRATAMETVIVASVVMAVLAMAGWFFLLAGSPLPSQ